MQKYIDFKKYRYDLKKRINKFDADFLLCEILKKDISELITKDFITKKEHRKIEKYAKKIQNNIPFDILFHKKYFFGNEFYVNKNVLSPRNDSEILVEESLKIIKNEKINEILDLCCGSGCLGLSIKKANKFLSVTLLDISKKALFVCKKNAKKLAVDVNIIKSDLLENINKKFDLIISNPPYIKTNAIKSLDLTVQKYDPNLALDGGIDGLYFYKKINETICNFINDNGYLILEIGIGQREEVINIFCTNFVVKNIVKDYNNIDRVVILQKK